MNLSYGVINSTCDGYVFDENLHTKRFVSQSPQQRQENSYEPDDEAFEGSHLMQMEKDTFKLRRDLQEAIASKRQAENRVLAYV